MREARKCEVRHLWLYSKIKSKANILTLWSMCKHLMSQIYGRAAVYEEEHDCISSWSFHAVSVDGNSLLLPEKHSRKSCSSLRARSIPFLACSSVRRVLISLSTSQTKSPIVTNVHDFFTASQISRVLHMYKSTYRTFSSDLGRTKMAMGWSWAACSLRTALADTSKMQCFPCYLCTHTEKKNNREAC